MSECMDCHDADEQLPKCFGPKAPDAYAGIPETERADRGVLDGELCIIDGNTFFVRGCLDLPIQGTDETFRWLVWASLSQESFRRCVELWELEGRESEPPYFGWLNTSLSMYEDTLNLKLSVQTRPVGERPEFTVEPTDHPLAVDQHRGIDLERARFLSASALKDS
ncbi:MAG: DUF2199 domain-containing protein [Limisphaerales bacterium]